MASLCNLEREKLLVISHIVVKCGHVGVILSFCGQCNCVAPSWPQTNFDTLEQKDCGFLIFFHRRQHFFRYYSFVIEFMKTDFSLDIFFFAVSFF